MRKKLITILCIIIGLLIILAGAIQIVLFTDFPAKKIQQGMQARLGLEVSMDKVKTGWFGNTKIYGMSFRIPLQQNNFLDIEQVRVKHNNLINLLISGKLNLYSIAVSDAELKVERTSHQNWNLLIAARSILTSQKKPAEHSAVASLRKFTIKNGRLRVDYGAESELLIDSIDFQAENPNTLEWVFQGTREPFVEMQGGLVKTSPFKNSMDFQIEKFAELIIPQIPRLFRKSDISGAWHGTYENGFVRGTITLNSVQLNDYTIKGDLGVLIGADTFEIRPEELVVSGKNNQAQTAYIRDGLISVKSNNLELAGISVGNKWLTADIGGKFDINNKRFNLEGKWDCPELFQTKGNLSGAVSFADTFTAAFLVNAENGNNKRNSYIAVDASGDNPGHSEWKTRIFIGNPEGSLKPDIKSVWFPIEADISASWPEIKLKNLKVNNISKLSAEGEFSAETMQWYLHIDTQTVENLKNLSEPIDLVFDAGLKINGSANPADKKIYGRAAIRNIEYQSTPLQPLEFDFSSLLEDETVLFSVGPFSFWDSNFAASGLYDIVTHKTEISLSVEDFLFEKYHEYFTFLPEQGKASAKIKIHEIGLGWKQLYADGNFTAENLAGNSFVIDRAKGDMEINKGSVAFNNVILNSDEGTISGSGSFKAVSPLTLNLDILAKDWPTALNNRPIAFLSSGSVKIKFDFEQRYGLGNVNLSNKILSGGEVLGSITSSIFLEDSVININQIRGHFLDGDLDGKGFIDIKRQDRLRLNLVCRDIDLNKLKAYQSEKELGILSGNLVLKPAEHEHPFEPLDLQISFDLKGGLFEELGFGQSSITAAVGLNRILITDSQINILGGQINSRARFTKRDGRYYLYANTRFSELDIHNAANVLSRKQRDITGRISGRGFITSSFTVDDMTGNAHIALDGSNLADHEIIGTLYDALNRDAKKSGSDGRGTMSLSFVGKKVVMSDFYYYNRGVEVRGTGAIQNLQKGKSSPIDAVVLATTRPLKDTSLPGTDIIDKFTFFAQKNAAAVKVTGTFKDIQVETVLLPEVQSILQSIFRAIE